MEISKCPVNMLWLVLAIPVFRVVGDSISGQSHQPAKEGNFPNKINPPIHIRPPPLPARQF